MCNTKRTISRELHKQLYKCIMWLCYHHLTLLSLDMHYVQIYKCIMRFLQFSTSNLVLYSIDKSFVTYGFHDEFFLINSNVRNKIIKNLSSTSPSSNIAEHTGPNIGSCNTLIGVIAKLRGTTNKTPEIFQNKEP